MTDAEFHVQESVRIARTSMSYCDCVRFLRGLVLLSGESSEIHSLHGVLVEMTHCDAQLELIAAGQLRLSLDGEK